LNAVVAVEVDFAGWLSLHKLLTLLTAAARLSASWLPAAP